jgi:phosphatidylglycerol---prolipoprotein diacylglyceryl transferase
VHPFIHLGLFRLPTYGLLLCVAILLGVSMAAKRMQKLGRELEIDREFAYAYLSLTALAALFGAKLTDWIIARGAVPLSALAVGGGTFLGGFLFGVLACSFAAYRAKIPLLLSGDACAPSLALGVAIVRIGCFAASCDYGKATHVPWAVVFTRPEAARLTGVRLGVPLHPSQLYESALGVVLFGCLLILERRPRRQGCSIFAFAALYSVGRFFLEFLRGDVDRGFWGPFSTSQWLSLLALLVFGAFYLRPIGERSA